MGSNRCCGWLGHPGGVVVLELLANRSVSTSALEQDIGDFLGAAPNKPLTDGACAPLLNAIAFVQRTPSGST
jgi:hypothetical protein